MITTEEMKKLEDNCGVSKLQLMENAGRGIFKTIKEISEKQSFSDSLSNSKFDKKFEDIKNKRILIISYHGNNGGDGFVAARLLCEEAETDILFIGDEDKFKEEAAINFKRIENNERIQLFDDFSMIGFDDYDIIIDAMLGTGVEGDLKEPIRSIIDLINESTAYKIAVDIPTGLNPDTGEVIDKAVNADLIITFHDIKQGLNSFKDKIIIVDIGIKDKAGD